MKIDSLPSPLSYETDPLSHPYAAFNGHSSWSAPTKYPPHEDVIGQAEGSKDAQAREAETALRDRANSDGWGSVENEGELDWPTAKAVQLQPSSLRVNPFHLLSHPGATSPLPPLPPHLQPLVSDTGDPPFDSSLPNGEFIHHLTQQSDNGTGGPPVHITKVTADAVTVSSGAAVDLPKPRRIMKNISNVFRREPASETLAPMNRLVETKSSDRAGMPRSPVIMQGPPPSPPISEGGYIEDSEDGISPSSMVSFGTTETKEPRSQMLPPLGAVIEPGSASDLLPRSTNRPTILTSDLTAEPGEIATNSPVRPHPGGSPWLGVPAARQVSNSSTVSRTGSLAVVRSGRLAQQRNSGSPTSDRDGPTRVDEDWGIMKGKEMPVLPDVEDGVPSLSAPRRDSGSSSPQLSSIPITSGSSSIQPPRMFRRSTNPTPSPNPTRSPLLHSHSTFVPSPTVRSQTIVPGLDGAALDSDIIAQAATIRRERLERRQKKASGTDGMPEGAEVAEKPEIKEPKREETRVLVGNLIGEDHVNYVLMYNMLTGIRIGVSRCQAKIKRALTDADFAARHKFSFDIVGNELTPSARYDFKFKDYAPWIFRDLRDEHFHLDPADYLLSLTAKYILSELGSPGKSGSFFYFSRDYRFIIKTIAHSEHKFLRSILKDYHTHVKDNPHTLLSRFYGLHRVKLPRGRKIHFVIMNNLFPPHRDIHETYDLKGSAFGREYPEEKAKKNPRAVLKDKNWVNRGRTLELGPEKRALLSEQLRRDMEFLKKKRVMDYSLLVGIHNMERGNRDNLRENQLTMFHPEVPPIRRKPPTIKGHNEASNVRKAVRRSDPKMLDVVSQLPTADSADRRHFLFYQDEGGLRATDEANASMDVIYYLGIIDICTPYNTAKKIEHFWKSMTEDRTTISCVEPVSYGQRFLNFLLSVMRSGDVSLRPPGLAPDTKKEDEKPVGGDNSPANGEGPDRSGEGVHGPTERAIVSRVKSEG